MSTLEFRRTQSGERASEAGDAITPSSILRPMPALPSLPKDALGRDIAVLLAESPGLRSKFGDVDLTVMTAAQKLDLLNAMKSSLGIKQARSRRAGYVGP